MTTTGQRLTHSQLVALGARWLRSQGCGVVITEVVSGRETADALGWTGTHSILVEVKTSRADFKADARKYFRRCPEQGLGARRYYMCPKGLITPDELPPAWGLIVIGSTGRPRCVVKAGGHPEYNTRGEIQLLLSLVRRLGAHRPPEAGVSIRAYTYVTKCTATLGVGLTPGELEETK